MRMLTGWCQENANNRIIPYPRGRVLGGSSAINVQMLSHPSKRDLDNWRDLGNENWSWDDLAPYFRKFETYNAPPDKIAETLGTQYIDPLLRGTDGPIQTAFPETDSSFVQEVWAETSDNLRLHKPTDPRSGSSLGAFNQLLSIDPKTMTRSYSASGYYAPNAGRPNLSLLTDAMVAKINFSGITAKITCEPLVSMSLWVEKLSPSTLARKSFFVLASSSHLSFWRSRGSGHNHTLSNTESRHSLIIPTSVRIFKIM